MENTVETVVQEKSYELRDLVASDMGAICKIVSAIGVRQFKECFNVEDMKGRSVEDIGYAVFFDIAGIVLANFSKAENDIHAFLSSLTGNDISEIKKMPFADYGEMIIEVVQKDDFKDFFKRVMKLFSR